VFSGDDARIMHLTLNVQQDTPRLSLSEVPLANYRRRLGSPSLRAACNASHPDLAQESELALLVNVKQPYWRQHHCPRQKNPDGLMAYSLHSWLPRHACT
jgi:hypothetical protein